MTLLELVERIKVVAFEVGELSDPHLASKEMLIEIILPSVLNVIVKESLSKPNELNALRVDQTIALTAGVGTLPSGVNEKYAEAMYFKDGGQHSYATYYPTYIDWLNDTDTIYPRFCVEDSKLYYSGQSSGNVVVSCITTPSIPATEATAVALDDVLLAKVIAMTAGVVRGEIPLTTLGINAK